MPVALSKIFRHSCIYVRDGAGISTPQDLRGKRVGTSQWSSTGLCFMRGMLQHDYGIKAEDMHWFMGGLNSFVEPPLIPLNLPGAIKLDFLSGGQTLENMFAAGELDALFSLYIPNLFLDGSPRIARLFPNFKEVEEDYYRRTRILPIMHTVVVREDVHREHPWVAKSIYQAFCAAKAIAVDGLYDTDALHLALPWLIDHVEEAWRVFGKDFWAYGLEPNRPDLGGHRPIRPRAGPRAARGHAGGIVQRRGGVIATRSPRRRARAACPARRGRASWRS